MILRGEMGDGGGVRRGNEIRIMLESGAMGF